MNLVYHITYIHLLDILLNTSRNLIFKIIKKLKSNIYYYYYKMTDKLKNLPSREDELMKSLCQFFSKDNNLEKMLNVTKRETITLRVLDWYVTIYSKEHITDDQIYKKYKLHLKSYSKKLFDPFCRGDKIQLLVHDNERIQTTVGQLNYFKWILVNNIIEIFNKNRTEIENYMVLEGFKKNKSSESSEEISPNMF